MPGKSFSRRFSLQIKFARISSLTETLLNPLALSSPKVLARSMDPILTAKSAKYERKETRRVSSAFFANPLRPSAFNRSFRLRNNRGRKPATPFHPLPTSPNGPGPRAQPSRVLSARHPCKHARQFLSVLTHLHGRPRESTPRVAD